MDGVDGRSEEPRREEVAESESLDLLDEEEEVRVTEEDEKG